MEKFKRIVKQLALSVVVLLLVYSCQKDDADALASQVQRPQPSITKTVGASEIPKVMQFLESKSNSRLEFLVDDSNTELGMHRSHEENLSMTTALTDHIKMVTNSYGKSNYTFELIEQGDKTGVYFINLVVKEYRDELYMYIVKYVPDVSWLQTHHISRDFNVFTGYLYFYSADGTYVGKTAMTNGMATSSFQKHPCEGETGETETIDNSNSSSNSSGSGGGGAIGSDCYVYLEWYECNGDNSDEEHSSEECGGSSGTGSGWTLVIICEEGIRSMRDALRHPCDGGSTIGGGTNTNTSSCETITGTTCNDVGATLMEWDDNCNCVESQTIENSETSVLIKPESIEEFLADEIEDNIISNLDPCTQHILDTLKNLQSNDIADVIARFGNLTSSYNWNVQSGIPTNPNNVAETNWDSDSNGNIVINNYTTVINNSYIDNATNLAIARTLLHEVIHTYILSYVDDLIANSSDTTTINYFQNNFSEVWNYYVAQQNGIAVGDIEDAHHEQMAANYIETIGEALAEYDNNQQDVNYYYYLAWGALFNTDAWNTVASFYDYEEDPYSIIDAIITANIQEDTSGLDSLGIPCP